MPTINKKVKLNKVLTAVYKNIESEWFIYSLRSIYKHVNFILVPSKVDIPDPLNKIKIYDLGVEHAINALGSNYVLYLNPDDVWPDVSFINLKKSIKIAPHVTRFDIGYFSFYKIWNYCIPNLIKPCIYRWPQGECRFEHIPPGVFFHNYRYLVEDIESKISNIKKIEGCNRVRKNWKRDIWDKFKQNPADVTSKGLHPSDKELFKEYIIYCGEYPNSIVENNFFKNNLGDTNGR